MQSAKSFPSSFRRPKPPTKSFRPKSNQPYKPRNQPQSSTPNVRKDFLLGELITRVSSPPPNLPLPPQSLEKQPFALPALPLQDVPVGGRLAHFAEQWGEIKCNEWVLSIVQNGFRTTFQTPPPLSSVPIILSQSSSHLLREEIMKLLQKRAVERVSNQGTHGFYSRLFLVPKKNRKLRPGIDLSTLNQYILPKPFRMETVRSVRQLILPNDWAVSIDLTGVYLHILIHRGSRKYLSFTFDNQVFQFRALPFSMSLSPWVFSKLMDIIAAYLRLRSISPFPYLNNWLVKNLLRQKLITQTIF